MFGLLDRLQRAAQSLAETAGRLARSIRASWTDILGTLLPRRRIVRLRLVEGSFPKSMKSNLLYVLTDDGEPWQAAMVCPCGCGMTLDMNLLTDERPYWSYSADKRGAATLHPSVWRKIGCKSHFWLREGKIIWC